MESNRAIVKATTPADLSKTPEGSATHKFNPKGCATRMFNLKGWRTRHPPTYSTSWTDPGPVSSARGRLGSQKRR
jgi:hypothetical protein